MMKFFKKFSPTKVGIKWLLNTAMLLAFIPAIMVGWIPAMVENDPTYITSGMLAVALYGVFCVLLNKWRTVNWLAESLVFAGLIGTVIGFIIAFTGIDPARTTDLTYVQEMMGIVINGLGVALYTTLIGSMSFLWYRLNQFCFEDPDV